MEVKTMSTTGSKILYWTPRILVILFAVFISLFALDVFGEGYTIGETIVALVMHLIPTAVILIVLAIAWRWEWVGGLLFIALGALNILLFRDQSSWPAFLMISGPLFLAGALFLLNWFLKGEKGIPS